MKKYLLIVSVALTAFLGCKKKEKLQASTWMVNGETFTTDKTHTTIGKAIAFLSSEGSGDNLNWFSIYLYNSWLPTSGNFQIAKPEDSVTQNPNIMHFVIVFNGEGYKPTAFNSTIISASSFNLNKASYYLPPTWFISENNASDSVLIEGTFNEP